MEESPWNRFSEGEQRALPAPGLVPATRFDSMRELRARQHRIIQLHVAGFKGVDIARALNITPETVSNTLNSPIAKDQIRLLIEASNEAAVDLKDQMQELGPMALAVFEDAMVNSLDPKIRLQAASKTLEYLLQKAGSRLEVNHAIITGKDIIELRQRMAEVEAKPSPELIEYIPTVEEIESIDLDGLELEE